MRDSESIAHDKLAYHDARALSRLYCNMLVDLACDFSETTNKNQIVNRMAQVIHRLRDYASTLDEQSGEVQAK